MKFTLSFILSFLMTFEPALVWAGKKTVTQRDEINNEIRNYLKKTGLTRKSMSVHEFYNENKDLFDDEDRAEVEKMVRENGDVMMPKFDVTMVKNKNGEEVYQLQAVQNGQATSITLFADADEFARVDGQTLSYNDSKSLPKSLEKLNAPKEAVDYYFPNKGRGPASVSANGGKLKRKPSNQGKFLSADQVMKMNLEQKKKYFQQLRQMMESIESVENAFAPSKGAAVEQEKWQYFVGLFVGDSAFATPGMIQTGGRKKARTNNGGSDTATTDAAPAAAAVAALKDSGASDATVDVDAQVGRTPMCVVAGNISNQGVRNKNWFTCGRDQSGQVLDSVKCKDNGGRSDAGLVQCNVILYGNGICVKPGPSSTAECNQKTKGKVPEFTDAAAYNDFLSNVISEKTSAILACGNNVDGQSGDVTKIKAKSMRADQAKACKELSAKLDEIDSWCQQGDKNPKFCNAPADKPEATTPTPAPAAGATDGKTALPKCEDVKKQPGYLENGSAEDESCKDADSSVRVAEVKCSVDDKQHVDTLHVCQCTASAGKKLINRSGKWTCVADGSGSKFGTVDDNSDKDSGKKKTSFFGKVKNWFGNNSHWIKCFTVALGVVGLVHYINKKATKSYYQQLDPVTPVVPITLPAVREGSQ